MEIYHPRITMFIRVNQILKPWKKQYSVRWSALFLWMASPSWGQDIHRLNEDQPCMHETGTKIFIRLHLDTETQTKQYPMRWSVLSADGLATKGARTSTGTIRITLIRIKQELQCLPVYMRILKPRKNTNQVGDLHCVSRWPGNHGGRTSTGTVEITFICIKQEP